MMKEGSLIAIIALCIASVHCQPRQGSPPAAAFDGSQTEPEPFLPGDPEWLRAILGSTLLGRPAVGGQDGGFINHGGCGVGSRCRTGLRNGWDGNPSGSGIGENWLTRPEVARMENFMNIGSQQGDQFPQAPVSQQVDTAVFPDFTSMIQEPVSVSGTQGSFQSPWPQPVPSSPVFPQMHTPRGASFGNPSGGVFPDFTSMIQEPVSVSGTQGSFQSPWPQPVPSSPVFPQMHSPRGASFGNPSGGVFPDFTSMIQEPVSVSGTQGSFQSPWPQAVPSSPVVPKMHTPQGASFGNPSGGVFVRPVEATHNIQKSIANTASAVSHELAGAAGQVAGGLLGLITNTASSYGRRRQAPRVSQHIQAKAFSQGVSHVTHQKPTIQQLPVAGHMQAKAIDHQNAKVVATSQFDSGVFPGTIAQPAHLRPAVLRGNPVSGHMQAEAFGHQIAKHDQAQSTNQQVFGHMQAKSIDQQIAEHNAQAVVNSIIPVVYPESVVKPVPVNSGYGGRAATGVAQHMQAKAFDQRITQNVQAGVFEPQLGSHMQANAIRQQFAGHNNAKSVFSPIDTDVYPEAVVKPVPGRSGYGGRTASRVHMQANVVDQQIAQHVQAKAFNPRVAGHIQAKAVDRQLTQHGQVQAFNPRVTGHIQAKTVDRQLTQHGQVQAFNPRVTGHIQAKTVDRQIAQHGQGQTFNPRVTGHIQAKTVDRQIAQHVQGQAFNPRVTGHIQSFGHQINPVFHPKPTIVDPRRRSSARGGY